MVSSLVSGIGSSWIEPWLGPVCVVRNTLWSKLSPEVRQSETLHSFKNRIRRIHLAHFQMGSAIVHYVIVSFNSFSGVFYQYPVLFLEEVI